MNDISIGAVGAAIVAGLVSILGLVIGKEQKISEFRQAWIDDLRKCMVAYLVQINAISDAIRARPQQGSPNTAAIIDSYKALNEASHGIVLRVNSEEKTAIELLKSMESFESLASINANLTPNNIKAAEENYIQASRALLKHEWKRVKRGEWTYRVSKYIVIFCIAIMLFVMIHLWRSYVPKRDDLGAKAHNINNEVVCYIEPTAQSAPNTVGLPFGSGKRQATRREDVKQNGINACEAPKLVSPTSTKISQNVR